MLNGGSQSICRSIERFIPKIKEKKKEKEKTLLDLYTMRKNMCRFVRDVQNV